MKNPEITLKQMRCLVSLAEIRHFRLAAEARNLSQPSLSAQIQNMEEILGCKLVERGKRDIFLTPIGREVYDSSKKILTLTQQITDYAKLHNHDLNGSIKLGVKATLGPYLLPKLLAKLHLQLPNLKLFIREGVPTQLETELVEGCHDVILVQMPVSSQDLQYVELFREPIMLAVSAKNPLADQSEIALEDIKSLKVMSLSPEFHLHAQVHRICKEYGAQIVSDYEGNSLDALRQMVSINMGVTFLPSLYAHSEAAKDQNIKILNIRNRKIYRTIGLVWRNSIGNRSIYSDLAVLLRQIIKDEFRGELELI